MGTTVGGGTIYYNHYDHKSRGTAILIPRELENKFKFISGQKDEEGRILLLDCEIEGNHVTLINVYFPTRDHAKHQLKTLDKLRILMEDFAGNEILLGGDFNTYLNPKIDKKGKRIEKSQSAYSKALNDFCEEFSLVDILRIRNPDQSLFTRCQNCKGGAVLSRLDYWLVSTGASYNIRKTDMDDGFESDHKIIFITLDLNDTCKRGKGFWKFNNTLLYDKEYVDKIKKIIQDVKENNEMENKNMKWDFTKCLIRTETMDYSMKQAKKERKRLEFLSQKLKELEPDIVNSDLKYIEHRQCKMEWDTIHRKKSYGIILRSKGKMG